MVGHPGGGEGSESGFRGVFARKLGLSAEEDGNSCDDGGGHTLDSFNRNCVDRVVVFSLNGLGTNSLADNGVVGDSLVGLFLETDVDVLGDGGWLDMFLVDKELTWDVDSLGDGSVSCDNGFGSGGVVDDLVGGLTDLDVDKLAVHDRLDNFCGVELVAGGGEGAGGTGDSGLCGHDLVGVSSDLSGGSVDLEDIFLDEHGRLLDFLEVLLVASNVDCAGLDRVPVFCGGGGGTVLDLGWLLVVTGHKFHSCSLNSWLVDDSLVDGLNSLLGDDAGLIDHSLGVDLWVHIDALGPHVGREEGGVNVVVDEGLAGTGDDLAVGEVERALEGVGASGLEEVVGVGGHGSSGLEEVVGVGGHGSFGLEESGSSDLCSEGEGCQAGCYQKGKFQHKFIPLH